jgi:hypothetical protein
MSESIADFSHCGLRISDCGLCPLRDCGSNDSDEGKARRYLKTMNHGGHWEHGGHKAFEIESNSY